MKAGSCLIIGGGIGGLTAAIALRRSGWTVEVAERDPAWSVYGVGIIQQANVIRAMQQLGVIDAYLDAGFGFDHVDVFRPDGVHVARLPSPKLVDGYPANLGIGRRALHTVLGDTVIGLGATVRLGLTVARFDSVSDGVEVAFSDGTAGRFDIVVGADGLYSQTRRTVMPDAAEPVATGQAVWRYNLPRPASVDGLQAYNGPTGVGLVPLSAELMYMFVTTPAGSERFATAELAERMRDTLKHVPPAVAGLAAQITDPAAVVYKPLEALLVEGPWHRGRVVLLGDAVHATTPHLGQGAGMAIEDSIVLAEELAASDTPEAAFAAYRARRFDRCAYIVRASLAICHGQLGKGPPVDNARATHDMFAVTAAPI